MGKENKNSKWRAVLLHAILLSGVAVIGYFGAALIGPSSNLPQNALNIETVRTNSAGFAQKPPAAEISDISNVVPEDVQPARSIAFRMLDKTITEELKQGRPTYALKLLNADPLSKKIKDSEYDVLRANIAQSYLTEGMTKRALDVAKLSTHRSKGETPEAAWVGGIAAWKLKDYHQAAQLFGTAAQSPRASAWLKSGSAFWAARAYNKTGELEKAGAFMELATSYPRTFYGLIALKSLNRDYNFNWDKPDLKSKHRKTLELDASVQAALKLSKQGNMSDALTKLGKAGWLDNGRKQRQLLAYVLDKDVPSLALHLGRQTKNDKGNFYDVALYPETPWKPDEGYEVDSALVNALIRQESRFNPQAKNASGASGLMQLMPSTASYMAKGIDVRLTHPQTNITVGQKYVRHLLMDPAVNNDLFYMTIAYNAGPGNLARWKKQYKDVRDPLLFIESIPSAETRGFVEKVMLNYWMYRIRAGQDNPSLDAVAAGDKGEYTEMRPRETSMQFASK